MDRAQVANEIRRIVIEQSKRARVGHIGSALSVVDILVSLYFDVLNVPAADDRNRDRFILSKGHAALALYAALHLKGVISEKELNTYCENGSRLGVHPEHSLKGIDFATGSLGMGLSFGTGAALAARLEKSSRKVYVLLSDAECNEGAIWESVMFAAHHKLSNLTAIIDLNGQQALGFTKDVLNLTPLAERFAAFGWDARVVDGHDIESLSDVLKSPAQDAPRVLIAQTTFGKGVSYMNSKIEWHYKPMNDEEYATALAEVGAQ